MNPLGLFFSGVAVGGIIIAFKIGSSKKKVKTKGSAQDVVSFFQGQGFDLKKSIAIAGNLQEESQFDTLASGDYGTAFGLAQWRGSRLTNLKNFAKEKKSDYRDFYVQLEFILHEFKNDEKRAFEKFIETESLEESTLAFAKYYERPQASTYPKRVAYAKTIYNQISES